MSDRASAALPARPGTRRPENSARPRGLFRTRTAQTVLNAVLGLLFGYTVLHPLSMVIFRSLDSPAARDGADSSLGSVLAPFLESFHPHMIPMGLLFGALAAAVAAMDGFHRATLSVQRDGLARQLEINDHYRQELQHTVRLLEARNDRLVELERANRRMTRFIVHDFKSHLGTIIGFSNLLIAKAKDRSAPEELDGLHRIRRQASRMLGSVSDLLDLERLRGAIRLDRQRVPPLEILEEVAADVALPVERGEVRMGPKHMGCPQIEVDKRLIVRVLYNLAGNALKHNPAGTRVTIDAGYEPTDEAFVRFSCDDNGDGIPAQAVVTVFEEFATASDAADSSGVGLAFAKAAVEAHGGRIWCDSAPHRGTTFFFTVPLRGGKTSHGPDDDETKSSRN